MHFYVIPSKFTGVLKGLEVSMSLVDHNAQIAQVCKQARIIPVIRIEEADHVLPLADALAHAGLTTLEVTLRSCHGVSAIERLRVQRPELCIGAGTVLNPQMMRVCIEAGAQFLVSPGITPALLEAGTQSSVPLLPGVSTASEIMQALEFGYQHFKLFPVEALGGLALVKSLAGPFPQVCFCPTGGITALTAPLYLEQPNVLAVGGSWMLETQAICSGNWARIQGLTADSLAILTGVSVS